MEGPDQTPVSEAPASGTAAGQEPAEKPPVAKSNKKWWFIGCGCALLLCLFVTTVAGIVGYVWYVSTGSTSGMTSAAAKTVIAQAEAIKQHDFQTAYDFMSEAYRAETDIHAFEKTVEANAGQLLAYRSLTIARDEVRQDSATVVAVVIGQDGQKATLTYALALDSSGIWKIEGFEKKVY